MRAGSRTVATGTAAADVGAGGHAADALEVQGVDVVVHEVGEHRGPDAVPEEEVPEPEAGDHRGDDLPPSPPRRMREAEDRGAREQERPRRYERLAWRIASQGAAEEVPQAARDMPPGGSGPRAASAHLQEPEDDGPERHRESDQRDAKGEFLVHARVREFEEEDPRVRRRDLDWRRRRDLGELEQQDEGELEERHGHPHLRDREPRAAAPESSAD